MIKPPPAENEAQRLTALRSYGVLDTLAEQDLDDLVDLAAHLCGTPIALISLVDEDRQWFKAAYGLNQTETPRDISFCGHAILQSETFVVTDASKDVRFADNPLVTGELGVRFYAGTPLVAPKGEKLGALCVMDRQPRQLTKDQEHALAVLSRQVMVQLELRRQKREMSRVNNALLGLLEDERRAETAMRESEELNRGVLNSVLAHIAVMDREGQIIAVNGAWRKFAHDNTDGRAELLARTEVGTNYLDACRAAVAESSPGAREALDGLEAVLKGNQDKFTLEYPCHSSDEQRWFLLSATPLKTKHGGAAVSHLDITERKQVEEQLLWKTAFFEAQVHSTLDAILVVDNNGMKILENQRMIDLWEFPPELVAAVDSRRLAWVTKLNKNPKQFADKVAYLYAHPDEVSRDELELINGKIIDRYSAPVQGTDGKHYGRIWVFRDITGRKEAERKIAEQAAFLDKARDAILVRNLEGTILFWNHGAERMYGWAKGEAVGRSIAEILYRNPKKFEEANQLTINQGQWHGELQHLTKNGTEITIEARWTLIRDDEGRPKSILAINTDITERKKIEAQFMRAQRMESIGTLAGGIAHDLNNILAPIMMSIEILKDTATDPQSTNILETIEMSAKRGADIVRQVLSFARGLEGERIEIQPKHLLREFEKIIKDTFPKDIRLRFQVPTETWTILGDPTQVHQILLNLCVNARDAMPNGGTLGIGIENCTLDEHYVAMNLDAKPGRYVTINVADTGSGMPPDLIEKIFEPFFTTKELNKGTGLGLSTVMAIVKSHGGLINVYSELGKGTTFKVYLPAMEEFIEGRSRQAEEANLPRGNGETILVVDDEASILTITSQTLQAYGYRVLTATDGAKAVGTYAQHKDDIAVVLTDMMMPVMDGAATIRAMAHINPSVKIIAASGLNTNGGQAQVSGSSVKHFLTKPYTAAALLKVLRTVVMEN